MSPTASDKWREWCFFRILLFIGNWWRREGGVSAGYQVVQYRLRSVGEVGGLVWVDMAT